MSFPADLTSVLTGATPYQLRNWRNTELLVPEVRAERPPLYSFRDLIALRLLVWLRAEHPLQRIRRAFAVLPEYALTEHPAAYRFATDGRSIAVETDDGFMDLVKNKGNIQLFTLAEIFEPFTNMQGESVVNFLRPKPHLEVRGGRMGGWPTVEGTRTTYDVVAAAVDETTVGYDDVATFYPGVSSAAARDAVDLARDVESRRIKAVSA